MEEYTYKKAEKEDVEKVNRINNIGTDNWLIDFFSAEKPLSFLYIALYQGQVIGAQGYVDYYMHYRGSKVVTHREERVLVLPEHRGKGVFNRLVEKCNENGRNCGSQMCWSSPSLLKPFVNAGFEKYTGFRTYLYYPVKHNLLSKIRQISRNYRLLNPYKLYKSYIGAKNHRGTDVTYIKQILSFLSFLKGSKNVKSEIGFTAFDIQEVNNRVKNYASQTDVYALYYDQPFMAWLSKKGKVYECYQLARKGRNVGHLIYYINDELRLIQVVDMFIDKETNASEVLSALSRKYSDSGLLSISIVLNNENEYHFNWIRDLKSKGVFAKDNLGNFVIKNLLPGDNSRMPISKLLLSDLWLEL